MNNCKQQCVSYLKTVNEATAYELSKQTGYLVDTIKLALRELKNEELVNIDRKPISTNSGVQQVNHYSLK